MLECLHHRECDFKPMIIVTNGVNCVALKGRSCDKLDHREADLFLSNWNTTGKVSSFSPKRLANQRFFITATWKWKFFV